MSGVVAEPGRGLACLFQLGAVSEFLDGYWPNSPLVVHGAPERLFELTGALEQPGIDGVLRLPCSSLRADFRTVEGKQASMKPTPQDARALYQAGFTIYAHDIASPGLRGWRATLDEELALPPGTVKVNAFASRTGKGLITHYDSQDNFIVQVRGEKRWRIAPNTHVRYPTVNYGIGNPMTARLRVEAPDGFPDAMPSNCQVVDMRAGSVMFLPRGYWHDAETTGSDSVHLVLEARVPTWGDLVLFVLMAKHRLASAAWREPVLGLRCGDGFRPDLVPELMARVPALAQALAADATNITAAEVAEYLASNQHKG